MPPQRDELRQGHFEALGSHPAVSEGHCVDQTQAGHSRLQEIASCHPSYRNHLEGPSAASEKDPFPTFGRPAVGHARGPVDGAGSDIPWENCRSRRDFEGRHVDLL